MLSFLVLLSNSLAHVCALSLINSFKPLNLNYRLYGSHTFNSKLGTFNFQGLCFPRRIYSSTVQSPKVSGNILFDSMFPMEWNGWMSIFSSLLNVSVHDLNKVTSPKESCKYYPQSQLTIKTNNLHLDSNSIQINHTNKFYVNKFL